MNDLWRRLLMMGAGTAVSLLTLTLLLTRLNSVYAIPQAQEFGYGFNVAQWDIVKVQEMGFNWIKVFNPPGSRLPVNVLMRVEANASHLADVTAFGDSVQQLAQSQKGFIDAYEFGNEPNLDASYGWGTAPNAADYATLLCEAYGRIKAVDPDAIVVSAGLAPVGRVVGNWQGHAGHNGLFQDEREFMKEFLDAGGGNCFDVFGYHPYGFSADFDAPPDQNSADSTQYCVNGFCFRGVEKIYDILQQKGLAERKIWATEFGWIVQPPASCTSDGSWDGRQWQIVSEAKQASNLVGAYEYATTNYPWMGAMFIFNLNFNTSGWYAECEQMRFYGVDGRPAETALREMPKVNVPQVGQLELSPASFTQIITPAQQPFAQTMNVTLQNTGDLTLSYTMTVQMNTAVTVTLNQPPTGTLTSQQTITRSFLGASAIYPTGTYSTAVQIETLSAGITNQQKIPITLYIWEEINTVFLPVVIKP